MKKIIFCLSIFCSMSVNAQQLERKDYIIQALESQRNEALAKEAICRADDAVLITDLRRQIDELKAKLEKPDAK